MPAPGIAALVLMSRDAPEKWSDRKRANGFPTRRVSHEQTLEVDPFLF
jgi:hypothetical protein